MFDVFTFFIIVGCIVLGVVVPTIQKRNGTYEDYRQAYRWEYKGTKQNQWFKEKKAKPQEKVRRDE